MNYCTSLKKPERGHIHLIMLTSKDRNHGAVMVQFRATGLTARKGVENGQKRRGNWRSAGNLRRLCMYSSQFINRQIFSCLFLCRQFINRGIGQIELGIPLHLPGGPQGATNVFFSIFNQMSFCPFCK